MPEHVFFNGRKYSHKSDGYWRATDGSRKPLHVAIWEAANGKVPDGYEIHHVDRNKDNNALENLQCLSIAEHRRLHVKINRDKGILSPPKYKTICAECGKEFLATVKHGKFCSRECKGKWSYSKGVVTRICVACGKEFKTSRYGKAQYCSPKCSNDGVGKSKFSDETIQTIRREYVKGSREYGIHALAKKYGVGKSTIHRIVNNETYKEF